MSASATRDLLPRVLRNGYEAFRGGRLGDDRGLYETLADKGQTPPVLIISCCDSRVTPEAIFGAGPGELFVVRNIANLVPPFGAEDPLPETPAAIEYAVLALKVAHIVVMGHAKCGGIRAYAQSRTQVFNPLSEGNFVGKWKSLVKPAYDKLGMPGENFDGHCEVLGRASVAQGLANLRTYPFVGERETQGKLTLHGAYFDISNGAVSALDEATGAFAPLAASA